MEKIRKFQSADLPRVGDIIAQIWGHGYMAALEKLYGKMGGKEWQEWMRGDITRSLATNENSFVIEVNGEVAGFATFTVDKERNLGTVGYNGVDEKYRGQGLGGKMLKHTLAQIKAAGATVAYVTTGLGDGFIGARKMYERAGFVPLLQNVNYSMKL